MLMKELEKDNQRMHPRSQARWWMPLIPTTWKDHCLRPAYAKKLARSHLKSKPDMVVHTSDL
jgi:hypothetical protein